VIEPISFAKTVSVFVIFSLMGCSLSEFDKRIEKSKAEGYDQAASLEAGLPFYRKKTFDPTWNSDHPEMLVRWEPSGLLDQTGHAVDSGSIRGKPVLLAFFFSECPDFCPMLMRNLKAVYGGLEKRSDIHFIGISVDPERDTPMKLSSYLSQLFSSQKDRKNWRLLTGTRPVIESVAKGTFAVDAFSDSKQARIVHTEKIFLMDQNGFVRKIMNGTKASLLHEIKLALDELTPERSVGGATPHSPSKVAASPGAIVSR